MLFFHTGRTIPANITARIMALRAAHRFAHANALLSEWEVN